MAGNEVGGYLQRLRSDFSTVHHYDLFVCQLSTNDNRQGKEIGQITDVSQHNGFDQSTTLGAIEEICRYVKAEFNCPLAFYTCLQNDPHHRYAQLIQQLKSLQAKWGFAIIDLFNNHGLHASLVAHPFAMFDDVHPTEEGYRNVWLPVFEQELARILVKG